MTSASTSAFILAMMRAGSPAAGLSRSRPMSSRSRSCRPTGRHDELLPARRLGVAGEQVEEVGRRPRRAPARAVKSDEVGVERGRSAGCSCRCRGGRSGGAVAPSRRTTSATLQWVLRPSERRRPRGRPLLERARPGDVAGLVEAGLELDERGDLLAVLGRAAEGADDGRVAAGAVEGLLDGEDVRIVRRLLDEADHRVEGLVRVVEQHVAARPTASTHRHPVLEGAGGDRLVRLGAQLGAQVGVGQPGHVLDLERPVHPVDVGRAQRELGGERGSPGRRGRPPPPRGAPPRRGRACGARPRWC